MFADHDGRAVCDYLQGTQTSDESLGAVYYDAQRVFFQLADYTGNEAWNTCARRARSNPPWRRMSLAVNMYTAPTAPPSFCIRSVVVGTHGPAVNRCPNGSSDQRAAVLMQALRCGRSFARTR